MIVAVDVVARSAIDMTTFIIEPGFNTKTQQVKSNRCIKGIVTAAFILIQNAAARGEVSLFSCLFVRAFLARALTRVNICSCLDKEQVIIKEK